MTNRHTNCNMSLANYQRTRTRTMMNENRYPSCHTGLLSDQKCYDPYAELAEYIAICLQLYILLMGQT